MSAPGWLSQRLGDVAAGDGWLGEHERQALAGLRLERRRAAWRLGRWTAKSALSGRLSVEPTRIEVLAAADGAPEAWLDGERIPASVSLSHRGDRALAVVASAPQVAGCDLEIVEPRSDAFVREWLTAAERRLILACPEGQRPLLANLTWAAKEAAAKVRRAGLRLDLRRVSVALGSAPAEGEWRRLRVGWDDGVEATVGWWRWEPGWVMVVAGQPAPTEPVEIAFAPWRPAGHVRGRAGASRQSGATTDLPP